MNSKYTNGYIPKIQYWLNKLSTAKSPIEQIEAVRKVQYFQKRHYTVYGEKVMLNELINL